MRKLFLACLALLLVIGVANAANFPMVVDPKSQVEVWTTPVYNNTTALSAGDLVIWDIGSSTGDDDNYITTTTTADTGLVAGVVWPADIAAGTIGTIAIWGFVDVDSDGAQTVGDVLCASDAAGEADDCTTDGYGFGVATEAADPCKAFINVQN